MSSPALSSPLIESPPEMSTSRIFICLTVGFLLIGGCGSDAGEPVADLVIRHVSVLSPRDGSVQRDRSVFIAGERIVAIRPSTDGTAPSAARVVDADGRFLIPGMWDLHTHFSFADPNAGPLLVTQGVTGARDSHFNVKNAFACAARWRTSL